ncbi:hypothetical protein K5I29_07910 [Flavobacterium agricola]|uniref:Uncharacterized protein n=1 Tax=Flavobacterium agricola TaxID=2870839 RepID=A0ABY6LY52_9FLAO|nr:hypothetical protein [Flavobacterium agricola]UYW00477.1 hypothetical protein K5I29_07910 [Flavobacterium agricola]
MKTKQPNMLKWFSIASVLFLGISFAIYYNHAKKSLENKKIERMFEVTKTTLDTISWHLNHNRNV